MAERETGSSSKKGPPTLEYQSAVRLSAMRRRSGSRIVYGVAAGICWFAGSIMAFGCVMAFLGERSRVPPPRGEEYQGLAVMGAITVFVIMAAVHFTYQAAKSRLP